MATQHKGIAPQSSVLAVSGAGTHFPQLLFQGQRKICTWNTSSLVHCKCEVEWGTWLRCLTVRTGCMGVSNESLWVWSARSARCRLSRNIDQRFTRHAPWRTPSSCMHDINRTTSSVSNHCLGRTNFRYSRRKPIPVWFVVYSWLEWNTICMSLKYHLSERKSFCGCDVCIKLMIRQAFQTRSRPIIFGFKPYIV